MPVTDQFRRVALSTVLVNRDSRQRRELEVDDLIPSIKARGVLQPIIITKEYELVAGERRLEASRQIGLPDIPARFVEDLDPIELQIIELEENIKRRDLEWKDLVKAVAKIHRLYSQLELDWTMVQTAEMINVTQPLISIYMRIAPELGSNEAVDRAGSVNEAINILRRKDQRNSMDALEELISDLPLAPPQPPSAEELAGFLQLPEPQGGPYTSTPVPPPKAALPAPQDTILNLSFLEWAPKYEGKKFNLIHCDFPYGIDVFSGPQARGAEPSNGYKDGFGIYEALLRCLCENLNRFTSISAHLMFWFSDKHRKFTLDTLAKHAPSWEIQPYPLIWVKSDNAGIASDPRHTPRHIYETCLLATRGKRQIVKVVSDAYSAPTDHSLHPSTKVEPMLRHFMGMLVDDTTRLLDPTCGSGAALRAAESLDAQAVLGLEIDQAYAEAARKELRLSRLKRGAASVAKVALGDL